LPQAHGERVRSAHHAHCVMLRALTQRS
jgi:hypothetical protein